MTAVEPHSTLGKYTLGREIGRGAFGVVYEGYHLDRADTCVAIKTVEVAGDADRILVEPALLAKLKHPCIVALEDYFLHAGKLVLALEYVPGHDLKTFLDEVGQAEPEMVRDLLVQLASALAEAHAQQIVHRDIKPSNILVDTSGGRRRFVLTDFGIGRRAEGLQAEKHVGGTYAYMAPEQLRGRPGPQSDLWALGVVAYQLLTGKLPFPGPSLGELARQIQYDDPPPPSEVTGKPLPAGLEEAVVRLLKKSLTERTGSAAELLQHLGVRGDTRRVLDSTVDTKRSGSRTALPISQKLARDARWATWLLGIMIGLYVLLNSLTGIVFLVGLWLFYHAQANVKSRGRRAAWTAAAFLVLSTKLLAIVSPRFEQWMLPGWGFQSLQFNSRAPSGTGPPEVRHPWASLATLGIIIIALFLPVFGSAAYANRRRALRERTLVDAALAGRAGSDEFLALMRDMIDNRFEDVGFHLRYAELLYARGDHRRAAVEARLITEQDPYHFNANLLLANAYYALGLYEDCRTVCRDYLAVTGYCFEFQELKAQCDARLGTDEIRTRSVSGGEGRAPR